jgi:hypothetical protein
MVPPAPALERSLGTLLGVRTSQIEWGAAAAFLLASLLADTVFLLIAPALRGHGVAPLVGWLFSLSADLFLTGAAMAAFRWLRNDAAAAALAAAGYTVLVDILQAFAGGPLWRPTFLLYSLLANFLFLLLLALAVRYIQPLALGLWLGATGAQLAASFSYRIVNFIEVRVREQFPIPFHIDPWDIATDLLFATVFAFAFWGGLALFAPRVLRD